MEPRREYEQEIDLKDLMFAVLRKWRPIVLLAIVFALLLGGFKILKGLNQLKDEEYVKQNQEEYEASLEQYESTKTRLEKELGNIDHNIQTQQKYHDESIILNINPYDEYMESATFYISTDYEIMPGMLYQNPNTATSILKGYMSIVQNGDMYNYVIGKLKNKIGIRYLKELVKVEPDYTNNMFDIIVIADTEKRAADVMRYIKGSIEASHEKLTEAIGEHDINIVDESSLVTVDLDLEKKQKDFTNTMDQLDTSLKDKTKELEDLEEPANTLLSRRSILKSSIKYAFLGGVLGAFMVVFFICVVFLMSDKLVNEKELKRRYGIMVLGVFRRQEKKRLFSGIDRLIDRMEGTAERELEEAQTFEVAAANAGNYIEDSRNVLLVGTVSDGAIAAVQDGLSPLLSGVALSVGGNLGRDAQAIKKAASCDAVIIVEKRNKSGFGEIEQELDVIRSLGKKVLGCIVL